MKFSERSSEILSRLNRLVNGSEPSPSRFGLAQFAFTRGLALIYLIAIVSWWVQMDGLAGSRGLVPAAKYLDAVKAALNAQGEPVFWHLPTWFLWECSDPALHWTCLLGTVLAVLVWAGVAQGPLLLLLWFVYLSLVLTGGVFMGFQWDSLLLEAGLIAPMVAPWRLWVGPRTIFPGVSRWPIFLVHFLLFKLMFLSGLVKLTYRDTAWLNGTALTYHYETQPIPHAVAWYAHHLPPWFQVLSVWIMFVIELALPFLIFLGRRPRIAAFFGLALLQVLIMATGNFAYFNLLTLVLCLTLPHDSAWPAFFRDRWFSPCEGSQTWITASGRWARWGFGGLLFFLSILTLFSLQLPRWAVPLAPLQSFFSNACRSVNSYGLFRVMTRERPEIVIEGSHDGVNWREYEFRWKPDRLDEAPRLVAPHQPRLDWQLWFAALEYQYRPDPRNYWFENLMARLLEGEPDVLRLLAANPFPDRPPRYLRARLYRYHFTAPAERRETGNWWRREDLGSFFPTVYRRNP